jgi:predicted anti-sigma-YlaC factor YlaD
MLDRICDHLSSLLEAAAAGRETDPAVVDHLAGCPACRESVEAVCWMRRMADTTTEAHALPNAEVIWWKAQLLRRWQADRRAAAPIERMHKAELYAGLASLVGFVAWQWSGVTRMLSSVSPSRLVAWSAQTATGGAPGDPSSVVLVFGSLCVGAMILAGVHRMLRQN